MIKKNRYVFMNTNRQCALSASHSIRISYRRFVSTSDRTKTRFLISIHSIHLVSIFDIQGGVFRAVNDVEILKFYREMV